MGEEAKSMNDAIAKIVRDTNAYHMHWQQKTEIAGENSIVLDRSGELRVEISESHHAACFVDKARQCTNPMVGV